ncbi:OLC1v1026915C1 [Oldenlandia corymbosa var. corymbosa]|uniref:OLC1v1026915C1 n=1 Tax=Oldenlandia corymbosa var. corymbosa TaxID=529605 RepID=A0AAV1CA49_OLDCO|nr:OLC1v1026915C1 [Oldenlandia corymbosa var. corymbosa]
MDFLYTDGVALKTPNLFPETVILVGNKTLVCHDPHKISSNGFWAKQNPLHYCSPLLLIQLSLVSLTSMLIDFLIRPLGHEAVVGAALFPPRGRIIFETFATFGIMFFLFTIGVRMDIKMMIRPGWKPVTLGASCVLCTLGFALLISYLLSQVVTLDPDVASSLPIIAASQSVLSFQNVSSVLSELKLLQSDLGRLAISSAMFADLISMCVMASLCAIMQTDIKNPVISLAQLFVFVTFVLVALYVVRPIIARSVKRLPEGKPVPESHVMAVFIIVLLAGLVSESIGQHFVFGPLVMGLVMPEGPPLGSAMTAKLDIPIGKILYPSFLTASGLKLNVFSIHFNSLWVVGVIVFVSCSVKLLSVMLLAFYMEMSIRESFVLGLMMNCKGISELVLFNLLLDVKAMKVEAFALSMVSVLVVTATVSSLIKLLYDPSKRNIPVRRRTIQHSKRDAELRVLVCVHNQEDVPEMLNLLEASNATEESHIAVIAVLLVELVGRANPMLIAHQSHRMLQPSSSRSGRIINALRQYELCNETCVNIHSFSSISHFDTMHEDICRVALDQNTTIIILPFHKRWEIDGSVGDVNRGIQSMNSKVADNAPCSVAILVDRGILRGTTSFLNNQSGYHVGVIFIGGVDDTEALAYASRMGRHPFVCLTIFRFLLFGSDNTRERKMDNNLMDDIRQANIGNELFVYQEEIVKDGVGLAASIKGLGSKFDLILVGRNHQDSPLLVGLGAWIECPELGVIGDMLAESDPERTSSILVVQQQRLKGKFMNRITKPVVLDHQDTFSPS